MSDVDALVDHVGRTIGAVEGVWAQIVPGQVRTDVIVVGADAERPHRTLVSTGMSSVAVPGTDGRSRTELVLALPADWSMEMDDASHWPFALLQNVAAYPHVTGISVEPWETLAFAEPPEPLGAGTELAACLVVPPRLLSDEAVQFALEDGVRVSLLALVPIYAAELDLARREGAQALAERLDAAGVTELLDPARPSVVADPERDPRRLRAARESDRPARGAAWSARARGTAGVAGPRAAGDVRPWPARAHRSPAAVSQRRVGETRRAR